MAIVPLAGRVRPGTGKGYSIYAATVRTVLNSWGPGKFDAELFLDGKAFRPDGKTAATLLPPAFGLAGAVETNLIEKEARPIHVGPDGKSLSSDIGPFEIKTFKVRVGASGKLNE